MNIRKTFYLNKNYSKSIGFEFSTPTKNWYPIGFGIEFDEEREIIIHFFLFFSIYIKLSRIFKYCPQRYSKTYGTLNTNKSLYIGLYQDVIRWGFWVEEDSNIGDYPKLRKGSFYFLDYILGRINYESVEVENKNHIVSFVEGSYLINVKKYDVFGGRKRWFKSKFNNYRIVCDTGDDVRHISYGYDSKIKNTYDAALKYENEEKIKNGSYFSFKKLSEKYKSCVLNDKTYFIINKLKDKYLVIIYNSNKNSDYIIDYIKIDELDRANKLSELVNNL
jgi:hypothetical protein